MRRRRRARRWQRSAVIFLSILFLLTCAVGAVLRRDDAAEQVSVELWQKAEQRIYWNALCAVSPMIGFLWEQEAAGGYMTAEDVETLLLAEQSAQVSGWPDISSEDSGEGLLQEMELQETIAGEDVVLFFPEDCDELPAPITEQDADLLAEIDRENERQRELAAQLAREQEQARQEAAEAVSGQTLALPYSMEQLGNLDFLIRNCYQVNKTTTVDDSILNAAAMLEKDMTMQDPDSGGPKILIHHTHATEYFADSDETDESTLIVGVGDYLGEILEHQYGIEVIHDRTVYPYNEAYSKALKHVDQILEENPSVEVFIDLHRDSGGQKKYTVEVDGKETAHLMFFNGLSRNVNGPIEYLTNENLSENLAFSFQMKMAGDSLYPGLCKRNYLKSYRYNLHVLPRAVIVEVGDNNNTLEEAKNAMEPLARILNYVLTGT